jgi:hypothetical protein
MKTESGLPYSKQPATGPHLKQHQSSLYHPKSTSLKSFLILFSQLRLGVHNGVFYSDFLINIFARIHLTSHACYMPCPSHLP